MKTLHINFGPERKTQISIDTSDVKSLKALFVTFDESFMVQSWYVEGHQSPGEIDPYLDVKQAAEVCFDVSFTAIPWKKYQAPS